MKEIDKISELQLKIKKLKIALKYYSNARNWEYEKYNGLNDPDDIVPIFEDKGKIARLALNYN